VRETATRDEKTDKGAKGGLEYMCYRGGSIGGGGCGKSWEGGGREILSRAERTQKETKRA